MTNNQDIDQAVAQLLSGDLGSANESDILRRLDVELQQQTEAGALVLGGDEPAPWVLGGEQGGGFGSMAQRFLAFYAEALHNEICDTEKGRLKDQYRSLISSTDTNERVKAIAPAVLTAIGVGAAFVSPAAIAAIVALWLVRLGLDQWCALPPSSTATSNSGNGTEPATIDPSIAPTSEPTA